MLCGEPNGARSFFGTNPDRASTTDESERVITNQLCRAVQREEDGVVGLGANGIELIGDAKDYARGVGTVGCQGAIVWQ